MLLRPGATPQSTTAVTPLALRQRIQCERIFAEERNIHDVLPCLDDRLQRREAHEPRHRADHQVGVTHDAPG